MKRHLGIALGLVVAIAAISGCSKSTKPAALLGSSGGNNGATAVDIAQTNDAVAANPGLINENQYTTTAQMPMVLGAGGLSAIRPIYWWRTIDSTARVVTFVYGDLDSLGRPTTAVATVHKHFTGKFNIVAGDTGTTGRPADSTLHIVRKPLDDDWTRQLMLRRFLVPAHSTSDSAARDTVPHYIWRVVGTSGVTVTSANATTQILSLRIQAGARDTTITDPLQLRRLHRILWIPADTPVTVTVNTGRADDIVVLYHGFERSRFTSNGDGTFTKTFADLDFPGLRHFGVNAFSKGTLTDDSAPYDSKAWVLPFGVRDGDCEMDRR
jgi:hypothetical protein